MGKIERIIENKAFKNLKSIINIMIKSENKIWFRIEDKKVSKNIVIKFNQIKNHSITLTMNYHLLKFKY